jgi:enoyl-CoA hydratase
LLAERSWIDECYAGDDPTVIIGRLQDSPVAAAREAAESILAKSPTAVAVTLESLRRARDLANLEDVLEQEYRVSLRMVAGHDVVEGIRAQVIDKDRNPDWRPSTLDAVSDADVQAHFASLGERELRLPRTASDDSKQTTEREATA